MFSLPIALLISLGALATGVVLGVVLSWWITGWVTLFGHVFGKKSRHYLTYQQEWLKWAPTHVGTFPTFEEWLTTRKTSTLT